MIDPEFTPPAYAVVGDAGLDLRARTEVILEAAGGRATIPVGFAVAIPVGWAGLVLPRSGLAARSGITVVNAPGLIDSGYRGEIMVPLLNTDPTSAFTVNRGDRIAQLVMVRVPTVEWVVVSTEAELGSSERASGGFGHTGRS